MALDRQTLDAVKADERQYDTETLPDGSVLRGRTLLRGELRRQRLFLRNKKGELDDAKWEYADDIMLSYRLIDDAGNVLITPEEAFKGYFDSWSQDYVVAAVKLLRRLVTAENKDLVQERRDVIVSKMLDPKLSDEDTIELVKQLRATDPATTIEDVVKNSDETPGNDSSGVSADDTAAA